MSEGKSAAEVAAEAHAMKQAELNAKKPQRLSSVQVGPELQRVSTGIAGLDACLAESETAPQGIPLGTSVLLSGSPGGGKSTIATLMGHAETGYENLILHGEERAERIKQRRDRLRIDTNVDPFLFPLRATEDALDIVRQISADRGIGVVVEDSVQTTTLNGSRKYDAQCAGAEMMIGQVCSLGGILVLVNHVSKDGSNHAGAAALAHLVDIHIHVSTNARKAERMLEVRKNRMGRAGFQVPLNITASGLSVGTPAPLSADGSLVGARTALEKALLKATELLLAGKRVDGYDFDQAGVNGSIWRAGLDTAVKRLERDGYKVHASKVNGRRGYEVEKDDKGQLVIELPESAIEVIDSMPIELT